MNNSSPLALHFSLAYVLASLRSIVEEFGPEHKAENPNPNGGGCIYAVTNKFGALVPVCIVGQFFAREGLLRHLLTSTTAMLTDGNSEPYQFSVCDPGNGMWDRLSDHGITASPEAQRFLRRVQQAQDAGETWADALDHSIAAEEEQMVAEARAEHRRIFGVPSTPVYDW